jgi:hypothetical protein
VAQASWPAGWAGPGRRWRAGNPSRLRQRYSTCIARGSGVCSRVDWRLLRGQAPLTGHASYLAARGRELGRLSPPWPLT